MTPRIRAVRDEEEDAWRQALADAEAAWRAEVTRRAEDDEHA